MQYLALRKIPPEKKEKVKSASRTIFQLTVSLGRFQTQKKLPGEKYVSFVERPRQPKAEARSTDRCFLPVRCQIYLNRPRFPFDEQGLLCHKALINGVQQVILSEQLRQVTLSSGQLSKFILHPGIGEMFEKLRRKFYRLLVATDVHGDVTGYVSHCRHTQFEKHQKRSQLIPLNEQIILFEKYITGPIAKCTQKSLFVLVITDLYSKIMRGVPVSHAAAQLVTVVVLEH